MEKNKIVLSICMIIKNEKRCLERCLKSLTPLREQLNCELIITDTGSTDGSIQIAKKYADKFISFIWCNDFSAARNVGLEQAQGEWIMVIDADEELVEDVSHLVEFFTSEQRHQYYGCFLKKKNCFEAEICNRCESLKDYKGVSSDFLDYRVFRADYNPRYIGIIHEYVPYREPTYSFQNYVLYHDGYAFEDETKRKQKKQRNAALLQKQIKQNMHDLRAIVHILVEEDVINKEVYKNLILLTEKLMYQELNNLFAPNAFVKVARYYSKQDNKQKTLEICQDYVKLFVGEDKSDIYELFEIDVRFIQSNTLFQQKQYRPALKMIEKYLYLMEKYKKGEINLRLLRTGSLSFANESHMQFIQFLKARCYMELGEIKSAGDVVKEVDLLEVTGAAFFNFYWLIVRLSHQEQSGITLGEYYKILLDARKREIPSQKKVVQDSYNMLHEYIGGLEKEKRDVLLEQIASTKEGNEDLWAFIHKKNQQKQQNLIDIVENTKKTIQSLINEPSMKEKALDLAQKLQAFAPEDEQVKQWIELLSK